MKKVKYSDIGNLYYGTLTSGKVYDVVKHYQSNVYGIEKIKLINDTGTPYVYDLYAFSSSFFTDVTLEYRNEIIDDILR